MSGYEGSSGAPFDPAILDPTKANDIFNNPMWSGPYAAPLTNLQLDSLEGFGQMMKSNPILQTNDLKNAITAGVGTPLSNPNVRKTDYGAFGDMFKNLFNATGSGTGGPSFDNTAAFKTGEQVFGADLERALAGIKEQYSSMGLDPTSSDRENRLLRTAGDETARFRLGQQDIARQSFEDSQNRGIAARGQQASMLPLFADVMGMPFREDLAGESLRTGNELAKTGQITAALPTLMEIFNNPAKLYTQGYGLGTAAQQTADTGIARMIQEFGRTQGGALQQMLAVLNGVPLNQAGMGPSMMSQVGSLVGNLGSLFGDLYGSGALDKWLGPQQPGLA